MLLRTYFELAYPHSPVFDPAEFMQSYHSGTCSLFLMHAVMTNTALYVADSALESIGFKNRSEAIESFYSRATLVYDFNCEKSHLRLLQGSIVLAMTSFNGSSDKNFLFWHHNAVRLALKMGIS